MKYFYFFAVFLFLLTPSWAQESPEAKIDSMLVNIDKSTFTSGILYDRMLPFAGLGIFNDSINISNANHFEQALNELYKASNKNKFISYKELRTFYTSNKQFNKVDIGIINASFHQLNYIENDTTESALKIVNGKFEKINNGKDAFIPKEVLIISPLKQYLVADASGNITFHFDNIFLLEDNENRTIVSIEVDFDNGTTAEIFSNGHFNFTDLPVNYQVFGYKILSFIVHYSDNTTFTTYAKIHIKNLPSPPTDDEVCFHDPSQSGLCTFDTGSYWDGNDFGYSGVPVVQGQLEYRVFYAEGNTDYKLLKPIIIIDGFDPFDKRKIIDDDSAKPANEHTSIEEMMRYIVNNNYNNPKSIIEKLNELGYDVIIVNHPTY